MTVNLDGGSGVATSKTGYTGTTVALGTPSKTGYDFSGWSLTSGSGTLSGNNYTFANEGTATVKATWTIHSSRLTVSPNGGTWSGYTSDQTYTQNYNTTKSISNPTPPSGKHFTGWTLSSGANGSFSNGTYTFGPAKNTTDTLTANYANHTWNSGVITTQPTCTATGVKTYTCTYSGCGATYTESVNAQGHDFSADASRVHYADNNKHNWKCSRCSEYGVVTNNQQVVGGTEDCEYGAWSADTATCTTGGTQSRTCTVCGHVDTRETSALNHNWVATVSAEHKVSDADCENAAVYHKWCLRCGENHPSETFTDGDPIGHDFSADASRVVDNDDGTHSWSCANNCGEAGAVISGTQVKNGSVSCNDTYGDWSTDTATCTTGGTQSRTCSVCGHVETRNTSALNHNWVETTEVTFGVDHLKSDANCEEAAVYYKSCSRCGANSTETFTSGTAIGHDFSADASRVVDNDDGTHSWSCANNCGEIGAVISGTQVKNGSVSCNETYGDWSTDTATCTTGGTQSRTCSVCGHVDTRNTSALNHSYTAQTVKDAALKSEATCTEAAVYYYSCSRCGAVEGDDSHTFTDGTALGHEYTGDYVNASDGRHYRKCARFDDCGTYGIGTSENTTQACSGGTANCVEKAVCQHCGTAYGSVDRSNHKSPENRAAVSNSCETDGYTAGVFCTACTQWVSGHELVGKTGHDYSADASRVHSLGNGTHNWACANNCGTYGKVDNGTQVKNGTVSCDATYGSWSADTATCTAGGSHYRDCSVCNYRQTESTPALGHLFNGAYHHVSNGLHNKKCTRCDAYGLNGEENATEACTPSGEWLNDETQHWKLCGLCEGIASIASHSGGTATCSAPANCETCGRAYGSTDSDNHAWSSVSYVWSKVGDDWKCTASRECGYNHDHDQSQTVTASGEITTPAKCEVMGQTTYTAAFTNTAFETQTRIETDVPVLGHDWAVSYDWTEDGHTCIARKVCENDASHHDSETVTLGHGITGTEKTPSTCEEKGWTTYTATFTDTDYDEQTKDVQDIAVLGHLWGTPSYDWAEDNSTCTATRICSRDSSHVETETVNVATSVKTAATCEEKGWTTYTATFTNDAFETQSKDLEDINPIGHAWTVLEPYIWVLEDDGIYCQATKICSNDGSHIRTEKVPAQASIVEGNCLEGGKVKYTATFTDPVFTEQYRYDNLPASGHTYVTHEAVAPKCEEVGYALYYECSVCGEKFRDNNGQPGDKINDLSEIAVQPSGHKWDYAHAVFNWDGFTCETATVSCLNDANHTTTVETTVNSSVMTAPTCTQTGVTKYTASFSATIDGETQTFTSEKTETVEANGHTMTPVAAKAATCLEDGNKAYYECSACNKYFKDNEGEFQTTVEEMTISALGHDFGEWDQTTDPTCTAAGEETRVCSRCDATETRPVDALGHDYVAVVTEPTCTEGGYTTYTCSRCQDSYTGDETGALGHDYVAVVTAPTCTAGGYTTYTCSRCQDSYTGDETGSLGHTPAAAVRENSVDPTCTEGGSYNEVVYCSVCGAVVSTTPKTVDALGHAWSDWDQTTDPTCTSSGEEARECSRCGATETRTVDALDHAWSEVTYTWEQVDDVWKCTAARTCGNDHAHDQSETVTATDDITTPATCEEMGKTTYTATFTNSAFAAQTKVETDVAELGHTWSEVTYTWEQVDGAWKCTASRTCGRDHDHDQSETVTASGEITVPATCEEMGKTTYTATFTNSAFAAQTKVETDVAAPGHTPAEAVEENVEPATCLGTGSYDSVVYCSICNEELSRTPKTVDALGHNYISVDTAATCTEEGFTTYVCSRCGDTYTDNHNGPLGHDWQTPTYVWADDGSTCTATKVCSRNTSHQITKTLTWAEDGGITGEVTTPATCTVMGKTTYTANFSTDDGFTVQTKTIQDVPVIAHTPADAVEENRVPATCSAAGSYDMVVYCSVCGTELSRETTVIPVIDHTPDDAVIENNVEPTCTTAGSYDSVVYCSVCGAEISRETVTVPASGHNWDYAHAVFNWSGYGCANATVKCLTDPAHEITVSVSVESVTTDPDCDHAGKTIYTATFTVGQTTYTDTKEQTLPALGHDYVYTRTIAPTCEEGGYDLYTCSRCESTENRNPTSATGHRWADPTYSWNDDNTQVTATRICINNGSHVETETVTAIGQVTTPATCTTAGKTTYTSAAFVNEAFAIQTKVVDGIPGASDHSWDYAHAVFNWAGYGCANATVTCLNDEEHTKTIPVTVTSVTNAATCEEDGKTIYTATFTVDGTDYADTKEQTLPATDHAYGEPVWSWAADHSSATATFTCSNDSSHVETVTDEVIDESTVQAICLTGGKITYTAEITFRDVTYRAVDEVIIGALGHSWGDPEWTWASDYSVATAKFTCPACHTVETLNAEVTSSDPTPDTCLAAGETVYTATVTHVNHENNTDKVFTDSKTVYGTQLPHSYIGAVRDNNNGTHSFMCVNGCGQYGGTVDCTYGEWEITIPAGCLTDGLKVKTCGVCEHQVEEVIPATGHPGTKIVNATPATCSSDGYTGDRVCSVCEEVLVQGQPIPSNGVHETGDKVIEPVYTTATCTRNAYHNEVYYCKHCGAKIISIQMVDQEALGHIDENGDGTCDRCGTSVETTSAKCTHICHNSNSLMRFIWKIVCLFCKVFHINKYCSCGEAHY